MSSFQHSDHPIPRTLIAVWHPDGPKPGRKLRRTELGEFPDAEAAEHFLRQNNPAGSFPWIFCYRLETSPDYRGNGNPVTIFDGNGIQIGSYDNERLDCFPGRIPEECRYQPGDILMFNECRYLTLGVVAELPPSPEFARQAGEESGRLDEIDDAYKVLYLSEGRWRYTHHHECELFRPCCPIPAYLERQQTTIRAGRKKKKKPASFYQKTLFLTWMEENRHLFSHGPYLADENSYGFSIRFRGIDNHITCYYSGN